MITIIDKYNFGLWIHDEELKYECKMTKTQKLRDERWKKKDKGYTMNEWMNEWMIRDKRLELNIKLKDKMLSWMMNDER